MHYLKTRNVSETPSVSIINSFKQRPEQEQKFAMDQWSATTVRDANSILGSLQNPKSEGDQMQILTEPLRKMESRSSNMFHPDLQSGPEKSNNKFSISVMLDHPEKHKSALNPHPFEFTILEQDLCERRSDLFLLIVVHTATQNLESRNRIRRSWGSSLLQKKLKTALVFALGKPNNKKLSQKLIVESAVYHDMIQEDFIDAYRNLTFKSVMWLRWAAKYCLNAKYLLKMDDDIFVNIFKVIRYLRKKEMSVYLPKSRKIYGSVSPDKRMPVIRDPNSKWFVSIDEYEDDSYPTYCSGWAYILTMNLVRPMYLASFQNNFFWIDDVYISGILPRNLNVTYVDLGPDHFEFGKKMVDNLIRPDLTFQWVGYMSDEIYFEQYKKLVPTGFMKQL